jgi:uncharacterized protein YdaT
MEIANALLEEKNMEEGIAIATAISRAKDWAANRGRQSEAAEGVSRKTDVKQHGEDRYVSPHDNTWEVKKEKGKKEEVFSTKEQAVKQAEREARTSNASVTIQGRHGKIERRESFNPNRKAPKQSWNCVTKTIYHNIF